MKKALSLALSAALSVSLLAGCASGDPASSPSGSQTGGAENNGEKVQLTFMTNVVGEKAAALESAKALQADGELSVADQPAVDEAAAALKAALEALEEKDPATPTPNPTEKPTPEPTQPPVPTPDPDPSAVPSPTSTPDTGDAGQIPATGDSVAVTALAVLLAAALAGVCGCVILKKRKQ